MQISTQRGSSLLRNSLAACLMVCSCWIGSCGQIEAGSPEHAVRNFASSANRRDYAIAEELLTTRLLSRIRPGEIDEIWLPGEILAVNVIRQAQNTAVVDMEIQLDPYQLGPKLGLTGETFLAWVQDPPLEDPKFQSMAQVIARYRADQNRVRTVLRFILFRHSDTWQIEFYSPQVTNTLALAPPPLSGPNEPFTLTGSIRSVNDGWIGVDILTGSNNLDAYREGWISVSLAAIDSIEDDSGNELGADELQAGDLVEASGRVQFGSSPDAAGRIPAAIRARRIQVMVNE